MTRLLMLRSRAALFILFTLISMGSPLCHAHQDQTNVLDPHALPLGDGKISTYPKRGYVYSCMTSFRGGGAQHDGDWIHATTWDSTSKITVQGSVPWPDAQFSIEEIGGLRQIEGNGLPLDQTTGIFPIRQSDPAYQIDRNPNSIETQQIMLSLPRSPVMAALSSCVPMGMIGVTTDGVPFFNALDDEGRDAVAHEVQDHCNGHPQRGGEYHYHGPSPCLPGATKNNTLVGYALDGFGIYSTHDENGKELTNADLDECHGRTSPIMWDGKVVNMYHYVLTREYPYTVGCFRGNPVHTRMPMGNDQPRNRQSMGPMQPRDMQPRGPRRPPEEAITACAGQSQNAQCQFTSPRGDMINGSCQSPGNVLACVPDRR